MSEPAASIDDAEVRSRVRKLSRSHRGGGHVIEHAAIIADGGDSAPVLDWIAAQSGVPEYAVDGSDRGIHGAWQSAAHRPLRYVLPPGTLD